MTGEFGADRVSHGENLARMETGHQLPVHGDPLLEIDQVDDSLGPNSLFSMPMTERQRLLDKIAELRGGRAPAEQLQDAVNRHLASHRF